jgi:hypothetical protein
MKPVIALDKDCGIFYFVVSMRFGIVYSCIGW